MIAIKMNFLAGRFHATPWGHHVNEGVVEYPPSLWRLLRSLVATFHRTAPENVDEASLKRILDALSDAPEFDLPSASVAHTRHYDQANSSVKFFDTFVSLNPKDEIVWIWRDAELDEFDRENLTKLLKNLGTFGRSESWCEARLIESFEKSSNSKPVSNGKFVSGKETIRLLLPNEKGEKLLDILKVETSTMRKAKQLEPDGSRWVTYERDSNLLTPRRISPRKNVETKQITVARFALSGNVLPLVTGSLPFAELARRCLIRNRGFNTEHSEVITGKTAGGIPLENNAHAHYLPTCENNNDGRIDHLTIFAPRGFDKNDLYALGKMSSINWRESSSGIRLILTGLGNPSDFVKDESIAAIFQKSVKFRSVTPFSLPNFPNRGGGKPPRPKDLPEGQLLRELRKRGLPEPITITAISGFFEKLMPIENIAEERPRFRWLEFTYRRFNGTAGNGLAGFEIEFAPEDLDKIETPLSLGFGCHFGLGLFCQLNKSTEFVSKMEQTIYTILGLLDEYVGRKIARCKAEVECFYESEKIAADLFEVCLRRLANEHKLQTEIKRKQKDTGHIYFYSEELNDLICSFYVKNGLTDLEADEMPNYVDEKGYLHYANGRIGLNIFPPTKHLWRLTDEERLPRLAFLKGAYIRYGNKNKFSFGNAFHKARLVEELLVQLGSPWIRFTRNMKGVPYLHEIEFKKTEEMKSLF